MKRIFVASSFLLIITLIFMGVYFFVFKKETPLAGNQAEEKIDTITDDNLAKSKKEPSGKIYSLTDEAVISPTIMEDGEYIRYYSSYNGNVHQVALDGTEKKLISSANLFGLKDVIWSPKKNKVISISDNGGKDSFGIYDFDKKKGIKLADNIKSVNWDNLGDKIVYYYFDAAKNKGNISVAEPDGSNWLNLASASFRSVNLASIPQSPLVSFWNAPDTNNETSLETVNILGGEVNKVFSGKFGADYLWSPDGNKILISSSDSKGSSKIILGVVGSSGEGYQNLNIPTLISKCVWSKNGKYVYYALPGVIPSGSSMPNDYLTKKITTQDTFWMVDLTTGKQERVIELNEISGPGKTFDAQNLFLSPDEDALFFVNRTDGKLYRIDL